MMLWIDMWKNGTELVHLEWEDFAEEILATVYPKTFLISQFASHLPMCQRMQPRPLWRQG